MTVRHAMVVGIERYDEPGWSLTGPGSNACRIVEWLCGRMPASNVHLFIEPHGTSLDARIETFTREGVSVVRSATHQDLDTFWRATLPGLLDANATLFTYWSGHGFTDADGARILICRDYRSTGLMNRVFNASNYLRHLKSARYHRLVEDVWFADVCAVQSTAFNADKSPPADVLGHPQAAFFATPENEYAHDEAGIGVFTRGLLTALDRVGTWPAAADFHVALNAALEAAGQPAFRLAEYGPYQELHDRLVGAVRQSGTTLFDSVFSLLSPFELSDRVYRRHFIRTVEELGEPSLASAQGLTGIISELASLSDGHVAGRIPYGLLSFLLRLAREPALTDAIDHWITDHARHQGNDLANIRRTLETETRTLVLVVVVETSAREDVARFRPFLRFRDLSPYPGPELPEQEVSGWDHFSASLGDLVSRLRAEPATADFDVHFLVDPPLFDRRFHDIPVTRAGLVSALGEECVVVLRHRERVLCPTRVVRSAWEEYADHLRLAAPKAVKLIRVPSTGPLPREKGLCYAAFPLAAASVRPASQEKLRLLQLLRLGAPYLYWPLAQPDADWCDALERHVAGWLAAMATLDGFPVTFTRERVQGNPLATVGALLWDDPLFVPFSPTYGVMRR